MKCKLGNSNYASLCSLWDFKVTVKLKYCHLKGCFFAGQFISFDGSVRKGLSYLNINLCWQDRLDLEM